MLKEDDVLLLIMLVLTEIQKIFALLGDAMNILLSPRNSLVSGYSTPFSRVSANELSRFQHSLVIAHLPCLHMPWSNSEGRHHNNEDIKTIWRLLLKSRLFSHPDRPWLGGVDTPYATSRGK